MPSRINTPFSSTMQPDAFDEGDRFGAQLQQRQAEMLQDRMDRLGMFNQQNNWRNNEIAEQRHEFDVGQDNNKSLAMAMLQARRDELGMERDRFGKQFDYMKGLSDTQNAQWQKQFDAQAASRAASDAASGAQTKMLLAQLDQMKADMDRHKAAREVPAPADLATAPAEVKAKYQQDLATSDPATAATNYAATMKGRAQSDAEGLASDLGVDIRTLNDRDKAWGFGANPTDADRSRILAEVKTLTERYVGSGMSHAAAAAKARDVIRQNSSHSFKSGWTDDVYKALGIGY